MQTIIVRLAIVLWIGAMLVIGINIVATRQFSTQTSKLVDRSECTLPCIMGIIPGSTHIDEAETRILALDGSGDFRRAGAGIASFLLTDHTGQETLGVLLVDFEDGTTINTMRLSTLRRDTTILPLGDIVLVPVRPLRLYLPCRETFSPRALLILGEEAQIMVELDITSPSALLSPYTPITVLDVSAVNIRSSYDVRASFGCMREIDWRGFAPLWRYMPGTDVR